MRVEDMEIKLDDGVVLNYKDYVASDGKVLSSERACIQHEKELDAIEKIKHIPFKISSIMEFDSWYYISSVADFLALKNYISVVMQKSRKTDFDIFDLKSKFTNDWVSYYVEREEDNFDCCTFKSFKQVQEDFREFQKDFNNLEKTLKEI